MANVDLARIMELGVEDRIRLAHVIRDSVAADPIAVPVTPEQIEELLRRLEEHERRPDDVVSWPDVERRIRSQLVEGIPVPCRQEDLRGG